MTITEARLRTLLADMADEARPAVLLSPLDDRAQAFRRRRMVMAVTVAVAVVAVAVSTVFVQSRLTSMPQPAYEPAEVFELGTTSPTQPGAARVAVSVPDDGTAYLALATGASVAVPPRDGHPWLQPRRLSPDGTHLVSIDNTQAENQVEVLNLVTGQYRDLDVVGYFAEVSPDNRTVAVILDAEVQVVDIATGAAVPVVPVTPYQDGVQEAVSFALGWSPDGTRLALSDSGDLVIVDRDGAERATFGGTSLVNGSQSWSPDGRSLLVYDGIEGRFAVQPDGAGELATLTAPADAVRPMGWAGDRIVWLAGAPGAPQRLLTADIDGGEVETWMQFDVGDVPVESVTWSRDFSG